MELERTDRVHAELIAQQVALQAALANWQQQAPAAPVGRQPGERMADDVVPGLGLSIGELAVVVQPQLAGQAANEDQQQVPEEAQKRMALALGEQIHELVATKRARRAPPAEGDAAATDWAVNEAAASSSCWR